MSPVTEPQVIRVVRQGLGGPGMPAGCVVAYGGAAAPTGWLLCDGTSYLRTTYADLFTAIGTTYGAVDGTHFTVPDMRGRTGVGKGTHADVSALANSEGEATVANRTPEHTHGPGTLGGTTDVNTQGQEVLPDVSGEAALNAHSHGFTVTTGVTASSQPPYLVLNYIIKT